VSRALPKSPRTQWSRDAEDAADVDAEDAAEEVIYAEDAKDAAEEVIYALVNF
jgi:hypothetical protein